MGQRDEERRRAKRQQEWARWAASGYRKRFQPRSVLRIGLIWSFLLVAFLATVVVLAARGDWP
jgi:hypothetical protein